MTVNPEVFKAITDGLEVNYAGLETEHQLELASEDPVIRESVEQYLLDHDKNKYDAKMILSRDDICRKYSLPSNFADWPWNMRFMKQELKNINGIDIDEHLSRLFGRSVTLGKFVTEKELDYPPIEDDRTDTGNGNKPGEIQP